MIVGIQNIRVSWLSGRIVLALEAYTLCLTGLLVLQPSWPLNFRISLIMYFKFLNLLSCPLTFRTPQSLGARLFWRLLLKPARGDTVMKKKCMATQCECNCPPNLAFYAIRLIVLEISVLELTTYHCVYQGENL